MNAAAVPALTARGNRTRESIKRAARTVFATAGYGSARVADIVAEAKVSTGAFYRYFTDKRAVLLELVSELNEQLFALSRSTWAPGNLESVADTTTRYLRVYRENCDVMAVEIEVAQSDPEVREVWNQTRRAFFARIERAVVAAKGRGHVHDSVDPGLAAALLGGMTEHYAYVAYVLDELPGYDEETVARHVMMLWGVGVLTPEGRAWTGPGTEVKK